MGADDVVALVDDPVVTADLLAKAAADVDIVIDYLWGAPAAPAIMALLTARALTGADPWTGYRSAMAGPTIELPSVALRSANLRILDSGQGAVSPKVYLAEVSSLVDEIGAGTIDVNARAEPLADVEATWSAPEVPGLRTVLVPGGTPGFRRRSLPGQRARGRPRR